MDTSMEKLCRICFQKGEQDLFSAIGESKEIRYKIYECFRIPLLYEKHKPCAICQDCIDDLNRASTFRIKCLTIEERFKLYCKEFLENSSKDELIDINSTSHFDDTSVSELNYHETNSLSENVDTKSFEKNIDNIIVNSFKCDICNKILKTKKSLLKHCVTMHEKRKHIGRVSGFGAARRYHCTSCSYCTPHSQTLVNHMRRHNGERPYSCECGKRFTQSSSLAAHLKTHSTNTYFTCALCGKQFKHAFAMKNHLRVHENGTYSCSICRKPLKSKQSLQAHMRRHYNICNYNCEDCGDTFVTSSELVNHRKKHNLTKKIECHLCGYKTHTKKNLITHLKRHTGNRSFKCNICQVGFFTQSNLQRHQRVHTRDKPYTCPTCAQKFTYSPSLNKHMKTVHGVDYKWADFKWKQRKIIKLTDNCED